MEHKKSIEGLRDMVTNLRKEGLNSQQIADELSLSQDTISWLLTESTAEEKPMDVRIGWRTIGVRPQRIAAVGAIMADVWSLTTLPASSLSHLHHHDFCKVNYLNSDMMYVNHM